MGLTRVRRTAAAVLTQTFYVGEDPSDAAGDVTVAVRRLDGTLLASGIATKPGSTTGQYQWILTGGPTAPASVTWQLDHLVVTWTGTVGGALMTLTDRVEVVGGFVFGLAEARQADSSLANPVKYPTSLLAAKRIEVETELERITGQAWVPRFGRFALDGNGYAGLAVPKVYPVRALRAVGTVEAGVLTALTLPTAATLDQYGNLTRAGGRPWPLGFGNVVLELEFGNDEPPPDLRDAAIYRLRSRLNLTRSGVPDRVNVYTTPDGSTYRITMPGPNTTGIPEVDGIYQSYPAPRYGFA